MTPDWKALRQSYREGMTAAELARQWKIPESTLRGRIKRENWREEEQTCQNGKVKFVRKDEPDEARLSRVGDLADSLLTCLERAVGELDAVTQTVREKVKKEDGGDMTTDYTQVLSGQKGLIDRGGLKQLTSVLKDLKDVLSLKDPADALEQEARIAKLQRDMERQEQEARLLVTMEGDCVNYAD